MSRRLPLAALLTIALCATPLGAAAKDKVKDKTTTTTSKAPAGHSSGRKTH